MSYLTLEIEETELARLQEVAQNRGVSVEALATLALRRLLPSADPFPVVAGSINVPPGFDWTKNSSWYDLMDEWDREDSRNESTSA